MAVVFQGIFFPLNDLCTILSRLLFTFIAYLLNTTQYQMRKLFNSTYRKDYFDGYSIGVNPHLSLERKKNKAFVTGFKSGRLDYENRNGLICCGIPQRIITEKILEDFLIAGMFGFDIETDGYTAFQINIISHWYQSGVEKYDPDQYSNLAALLNTNNIEMNLAHQ